MTADTDHLGLFLNYVENTIANHEFDAWKMIDADNKLRLCIAEHRCRSSDTQFSRNNDGYSQAALLDQLDEWTLQAEIQLMHMLARNIHLRVRIIERMQQSIMQPLHVAEHSHAESKTMLTEVAKIALRPTKIEINDASGDSMVDNNLEDGSAWPQQSSEDQVSSTEERWPCSWCKRVVSSKLALDKHEMYCLSDRTCDVCGKVYTVKMNRIKHSKKEHPWHKIIFRPVTDIEKWPCPLCLREFSSKLVLENHEKYCLLDRTCEVCGMVFTQKPNRFNHIINQHPEHRIIANGGKLVSYQSIQHLSRTKGIVRECIVCKEQFAFYKLYLQHLKMHKQQGYPCDQCQLSLRTLRGWRLHRAQHKDERNFVCDICSKRFATKKSIYYHMRKHTGRTTRLCNVCGKILKSGTALKHHMMTHSVTERPTYPCHLCKGVFKKCATLKSHLETHDTERKFECFDCGKQASTSHAMKVHMQRHSKPANFKCALCPREFYSQWALDSHTWTHSTEKRFSCSLCAKQFKSPYALKYHEREHRDAEAFLCGICNKEFKSVGSLNLHKQTHDQNRERKFKCDQCPKAFYAKAVLECHMRSHSGDKPFSCAICGQRFTSAGNMKQHEITHTGERPFGCTICEKRFTKNHELLVHTRLHSGEKPFACNTCSYRCADKRNLSKHMRSH